MAMLSTADQTILNNLIDIPIEHKRALEDLWDQAPEPEMSTSKKFWHTVLKIVFPLLLPAMCLALIARLVYPEVNLNPVLNLIWFIVISLSCFGVAVHGLFTLGIFGANAKPENMRKFLENRGVVQYLGRRSVWGHITIFLNIALIALCVMTGWGLTALVYMGSWMIMLVIRQVGKSETKKAIAYLYANPPTYDEKDVTPRNVRTY